MKGKMKTAVMLDIGKMGASVAAICIIMNPEQSEILW